VDILYIRQELQRRTISSMFVAKRNHKTSKRLASQASQLYTECNRKLAFKFDDTLDELLSQKSELHSKKTSNYTG
jgi:hypothetical protein